MLADKEQRILRGSGRTGRAGDVSAAPTPLEGVAVKGQDVRETDR